MKKLLLLTGLVGALWLIYGLFENVFEFSYGWKTIPSKVFSVSFEGKTDDTFKSEIEIARKELRKIHKKSLAPAVSVAISVDSEIIWSEALGLRNIDKNLSADTTTLFRIGSTSKVLTSLGLGILLDKNLIDLDSSIQYYTDHFKSKPSIKIRQLASHQSGIRNYGLCACFPIWEYYRDRNFTSVEESLRDFENDELLFLPGNDYSYSSYNFTALSHAMEKVAARDFLSLMESMVFEPLAMRSTQANFKNNRAPNQSQFYDIRDNEYKLSPDIDLSNKWAGGGFLSNPSDLIKAGNAILSEGFLSETTIQELVKPQRLNNNSINPQGYALGWRHSTSENYLDEHTTEIIHHGGMAVGSQSLLIIFPEYDMVISLLLNKSGEEGSFKLFDYLHPIASPFIEKLEREK